MLPWTSSTRSPMASASSSRSPPESRTTPTTVAPRASKPAASPPPTNPPIPVTSTVRSFHPSRPLSLIRSTRSFARNHSWDGPKQDLQVQPKRPLPRVAQVEPDHPVVIQAAAAAHLPEAGQSRPEVQPQPLVDVVIIEFVVEGRTGADEAHFARQNVDQLRELIEATSPKQATNSHHPWVRPNLEEWRLHLIESQERAAQALGVGHHGAKLVNAKAPAIASHALLAEEDRAGRVQLDRHRDDRKQRHRQKQQDDRAHHVDASVCRGADAFWPIGRRGEDQAFHRRPEVGKVGQREVQRRRGTEHGPGISDGHLRGPTLGRWSIVPDTNSGEPDNSVVTGAVTSKKGA